MITRVNFLEKELFILTYRRAVLYGGAVLGVFALLALLQFVQVRLIQRNAVRITQEVTQLKLQREQAIAETSQGSVKQGKELVREILSNKPRWSLVLKRMTKMMPPGLWLVSLKTYEKGGEGGGRGILLSGESENEGQISTFLKALSNSWDFFSPVLTESKEELRGSARVYTFTIDAGLVAPSKREIGS